MHADGAPLRRWQRLLEVFCAAAAGGGATSVEELSALLELLRPRARKVGASYAAYFALSEAQAWVTVQRADLALRCLQAVERELPDEPFGAVERALYLIDLMRALGQLDTALERLDELEAELSTSATPEAPARRARLSRTRAEVLRDLGLLAQASEQVAIAQRLAAAAGNRVEAIDALLVECDVLLMTDRAEQARAIAAELLTEVAASERATRAALIASVGYAESSLARRDPTLLPRARETLRAAVALAEGPVLTRILVKLVDLALRSGDLDAARAGARDCAARLGIEVPDAAIASPDACELVHLETRILLATDGRDAGALASHLPRQRRAVRWLIDDWVRMKPSRDGIGFLHLATRRQIVAAAIALERATAVDPQDGAARALRLLLDLQARTSLARSIGAPDCDLATLRAELFDTASGALIYLPANELSLVLAVDDDAVTVHDLAIDLGRSEAVRSFVRWTAAAPVADAPRQALLEDSVATLGRQVAEQVLPDDLRARLAGWRALTVVGADLARDLPFELLSYDDARLLGEVCAIDYTPSLAFSLHARRRHRAVAARAPTQVLVCTAPPLQVAQAHGVERFDFDPGWFGALPEAVRVRDGATLAELHALTWPPRGVVHLVAHGVRGSAEQGLGLAFADGVLWQNELTTRRVAGIVLVSACGASRSVSRPGEGTAMASIAGTLLWQGADAVVVSRNDLVASDHLRVMGDVHRAVAEGQSLARALQLARAARGGAALWQRVQLGLVQVIGDGHAAR